MVKVKITRDCSIEGKHYSEGDLAEVIEKNARYWMAIGKAMAYDGKPEPKRLRRTKSRWVWSLTSE